MFLILPRMTPVAPGATIETRRAMFEEYRDELRRLNPQCFNADGSQRRWWQVLFGTLSS